MREPSDTLTPGRALLWIACLAMLSVGAKNFEAGLSVDAPLYAYLARGIVRTHDWFYLRGSVEEMIPFVEHPHLGLWLIALVFKVLPASDWAARIVGHVFYVGFLWMFFLYLRRVADERTAGGAVLLLWLWFRFANFFSNVYLDPGTLFFGAAAVFAFDFALREKRFSLAALGGACLSLCAMYKGLTVLGFLPVFPVLLLLRARRAEWRASLINTALFIAASAAVLGAYYLAIRASRCPDFLALYWRKQWVGRFERQWDWGKILSASYWSPFFKDTYNLVILAPLVFLGKNQKARKARRAACIPFVLLVSFVAMFAPAGRDGAHYRIMQLPWVAWMVSAATLGRFSWPLAKVARPLAIFCLVAVLVLQYIPNRVHGVTPPPEIAVIEHLKKERAVKELIFDMAPEPFNFTYHDLYAWYSDLPMSHFAAKDAPPSSKDEAVYLLFQSSAERETAVHAQGWCLYDRYGANSLWLKCAPGGAWKG